MIYQSEHVLSVFTCSEIVKFWSSACFQSSATYHLFYLSILSFNLCYWNTVILIQHLGELLFDSPFSEWELHISATYLATVSLLCSWGVFAWMPCHLFSSSAYWAALCGPSLSSLWTSSQILCPLIQAGGEDTDLSLLSTLLCWGSRRKVEGFEGFFVLILLLYLLVC